MTDEMLVAQAEWLPQYVQNGSVESAKSRLAEHEKNNTRVKTVDGFQGMARLHTKNKSPLLLLRRD